MTVAKTGRLIENSESFTGQARYCAAAACDLFVHDAAVADHLRALDDDAFARGQPARDLDFTGTAPPDRDLATQHLPFRDDVRVHVAPLGHDGLLRHHETRQRIAADLDGQEHAGPQPSVRVGNPGAYLDRPRNRIYARIHRFDRAAE